MRVIIVHRWEGRPSDDWYPWLKKELEKNNVEIIIPDMPNTNEPEINAWVSHLKEVVGEVDENTYFVGHSIGCQTILRYLASLDNAKIGGCIFVSPWIHLKDLEDKESEEVAKPWLEIPIEWNRLTQHKFVCIFSDDDPFVPISDVDIFKNKLNAKIIIQKNMGHFNMEECEMALGELMFLVS